MGKMKDLWIQMQEEADQDDPYYYMGAGAAEALYAELERRGEICPTCDGAKPARYTMCNGCLATRLMKIG